MSVTDRNADATGSRDDASESGAAVVSPSRSPATLAAGLAVLVGAIVLAAHWPVLSAGAVSLDDTQYLFENPMLQHPSWASAKLALSEVFESSTVEGYYEPLTLISLMIDVALGGRKDDLTAFHRTSLALHVLNTMMVVALLYLLVGDPWAAGLAALLFGVHPLTVEPVAWVWERKTLLATFFALPCLIAYVRYARTGNRMAYAASLAAFVLALMAKPTITPLPLLLLLLDFWPLGRLRLRSLLEKLPFFAVAAVSAVITIVSTARNAVLTVPDPATVTQIPLKISYLLLFYLGKILWPAHLSPVYVLPEPLSIAQPLLLGALLGAAALFTLAVVSLRWTRALASGWLFFVAALSPTLGLIGYSWVSASDKYVYFPAIGLLMILVGLLVRAGGIEPARRRRAAVAGLVLLVAAAETWATRRCLRHWQDTEQHNRHLVRLAPNSPAARHNLGYALARAGKTPEAVAEFEATLRLRPGLPTAHNNLGAALADLGRLEEALYHHREALKTQPRYAAAHRNLADALLRLGDASQAAKHYVEALNINPDLVAALNNLAWIQATRPDARPDDIADAIRRAERARELTRGRSSDVLDTLAAAYAAAGRFDEAAATATQAATLAEAAGRKREAEAISERRRLYERRTPYREAPASSAPTATRRAAAP